MRLTAMCTENDTLSYVSAASLSKSLLPFKRNVLPSIQQRSWRKRKTKEKIIKKLFWDFFVKIWKVILEFLIRLIKNSWIISEGFAKLRYGCKSKNTILICDINIMRSFYARNSLALQAIWRNIFINKFNLKLT